MCGQCVCGQCVWSVCGQCVVSVVSVRCEVSVWSV